MSSVRCDDVRAAFVRGDALWGETADPVVVRHVGECPACQALYAEDASELQAEVTNAAGQEPFDPAGLAALKSSVLQQKTQEDLSFFGKWRSLPQGTRWGVALGLVAVAAGFALLRGRVDLGVYPWGRMALALVSQSLLTLLLCSMILRPLYKPAWPRALWPWILLALAVPLALAILPQAPSPNPESLKGAGDDWLGRALGCATWGTVVASPFVIGLLGMDRLAGRWRQVLMTAAVTGGLVGNLALQLHCPLTHPVHLVPGHALVGLILLGLVGLWMSGSSLRKHKGNQGV